MDIIRKIGNPFKGLLSLASIARKEPESYVPGYDLYAEMPDSIVTTPKQDIVLDDWFQESIVIPYPHDGVPKKEETIHEKMYELSTSKGSTIDLGGSENLT